MRKTLPKIVIVCNNLRTLGPFDPMPLVANLSQLAEIIEETK